MSDIRVELAPGLPTEPWAVIATVHYPKGRAEVYGDGRVRYVYADEMDVDVAPRTAVRDHVLDVIAQTLAALEAEKAFGKLVDIWYRLGR